MTSEEKVYRELQEQRKMFEKQQEYQKRRLWRILILMWMFLLFGFLFKLVKSWC